MAQNKDIEVAAEIVTSHWSVVQWLLTLAWGASAALFTWGWRRHEKEIRQFEAQRGKVQQFNRDLDTIQERLNSRIVDLERKLSEIHDGHTQCRHQCDLVQVENKRVQERIFDSIDKLRQELGGMNQLLGRALGLVEARQNER